MADSHYTYMASVLKNIRNNLAINIKRNYLQRKLLYVLNFN